MAKALKLKAPTGSNQEDHPLVEARTIHKKWTGAIQ